MKKLILIFIAFYYASYSQNTFSTFIINDSLNLSCHSVIETDDNAFLISCNSDIITNSTVYNKSRLIKIDYKGDLLWNKIFLETSSSEFSEKIINGLDGGYLLASSSYSYPIEDEDTLQDILIRKIDFQGNIEWFKVYPARFFSDIIITSDSSYLILGQVHEQNGFISSDAIIYKIDLNGNIIWSKRYGTKNIEWPFVRERPKKIYEIDNNYYFSGLFNQSDSSIYSHGFIYKIDKSGNEYWKLKYPFNQSNTTQHISSIFKFKANIYFNSYWNDEFFKIDTLKGGFKNINSSIKLRALLGNKNKNFDVDCNVITTINIKDSFLIFNKYSNFNDYFFEKVIKKNYLSYSNPNKQRLITDMQRCSDNGYVYLTTTNINSYLITKTDCLGNDTYWSTECNPKLKKENNILIYPNPTNNLLNIETNYDITNIEVINPIGQTINYKNYCNCNKQTIKIEHLPKGNYYIKVIGKENQGISKFIKN